MISTVCYGNRVEWPSLKEASDHFRMAADCSEGCERERYVDVLMDLLDGRSVAWDKHGEVPSGY